MKKSTINLWDFVGKVTNPRFPHYRYSGILHQEGYQVATDAITLIIAQFPYPEEHEGKTINKKGDIVDRGNFSLKTARMVLPGQNLNEWVKIPINYSKIETWYNEVLTPWQKHYTGKDKKCVEYTGVIQIGETAYYDTMRFKKLLKVLKKIKAKDFYLSPKGGCCRHLYSFGELDGQSVEVMLMPLRITTDLEELPILSIH